MWERSVLSRRALLKNSLLMGVFTGAGIAGFRSQGIASAAQDANQSWEKIDTGNAVDSWEFATYHACSVGWYGAFSSGNGNWMHEFRISNEAASRVTNEWGGSHDGISELAWGVNTGTTTDFAVSVKDENHGLYPSPTQAEDTFDHSDIAYFVANVAIDALKNSTPVANFAFTALEIADKYIPEQGEPYEDYEYSDYWNFDQHHSDIGQYRRFYAETGSTRSTFDMATMTSGNYGMDTSTYWTFHIEGDYSPTEGIDYFSKEGTKTKFGTLIARPKPGWLVEKIPPKKISNRLNSLQASKTISDQLDLDNPIYYAHDAPVDVDNQTGL